MGIAMHHAMWLIMQGRTYLPSPIFYSLAPLQSIKKNTGRSPLGQKKDPPSILFPRMAPQRGLLRGAQARHECPSRFVCPSCLWTWTLHLVIIVMAHEGISNSINIIIMLCNEQVGQTLFSPSSSCSTVSALFVGTQLEQEHEHLDPRLQEV